VECGRWRHCGGPTQNRKTLDDVTRRGQERDDYDWHRETHIMAGMHENYTCKVIDIFD